MQPEGRTATSKQAVLPDEDTFDSDPVEDPELSEADLFDLVSFTMLLAAPRPDPPTEETERGAQTFDAIGCTDCHVPSLQGPRGPIPAYSDLLLHDMGAELADGFTMGEASRRGVSHSAAMGDRRGRSVPARWPSADGRRGDSLAWRRGEGRGGIATKS